MIIIDAFSSFRKDFSRRSPHGSTLASETDREPDILVQRAQCKIGRVVLAGQEPLAEPVEGAHPVGRTLAHRLPRIDRVDPGLDAHRKDFGERHPENGTGAVVHELGDRVI
jgi:hypothetical protein